MFCSSRKLLSNQEMIDKLLEKQGDLSVRILEEKDEDEMVDTLADAFLEDPMVQWLAGIPDSDEKKEASIKTMNRWSFRAMDEPTIRQKNGAMFGVMDGSKMAGAMSIIPSSHQPRGIFGLIMYTIFKGGLPPWVVNKKNYGKFINQRSESLFILTKKRKENMAPYPRHIYLLQVGVRREHHGKGVGGKLFRMLFAAADSLQVPVYLETESEENESMYHHYGFQTLDTVLIKAKGDDSTDAQFKMWLMLRLPK